MSDQGESTATATAGKPQGDIKLGELEAGDVAPRGILSDRDILEEVERGSSGDVVIEPFNRAHLGNNSYDVTLGEAFYADPGPSCKEAEPKYYCPWNPDAVCAYWGNVQTAELVSTDERAKQLGVRRGDKVIIIPPGSTFLCHTQEFIGGRGCVTSVMKTRSGIGRSGLCVCKAAGLGDIGFVTRWTMEISNAGRWHVPLIVGERVGQIVFERTGKPIKSYEKNGSYQKADPYNLDAVKAEWKPHMMLPRLTRDPPSHQ